MARYIIDCAPMKSPYSGLYRYCLNLGETVTKLLSAVQQPSLHMYLPPARRLPIANKPYYIRRQPWHTLLKPFLADCRIWHVPFQLGQLPPRQPFFPAPKAVLTIHDLNVLHENQPASLQRKTLAHTQRLIDRSDAIVCISEFTKSDVLKHCNVTNKPIYVIHNGVDQYTQPVLSPPIYRPTREFLLGIGYINPKKNFHVLLPLLQSNPDLELILIGRPDEPSYVRQLQHSAQALHVADRLHLLGTVSETDKAWYLQHCKALLHPSLAEGFGLPVIEAMQLGKPVFLSTLTSLPEIGGEAAFYFPDFHADTIQHVFERGMQFADKPGRTNAVIQHAAQFTWERSARQYLNIYKSLDPALWLPA